MAITQLSSPPVGLSLGKKLLTTSRVGGVGSKQRRVAGKKWSFEMQVSHISERCPAWSSWGGGVLDLQSAGSREKVVLLGSMRRRRNVIGVGSEYQNEKRLYLQRQTGVAASNSSSSSSVPGSSGVDAAAQNQGEDSGQYSKDYGNWINFKNQSSSESDSFSAGWESEQDLVGFTEIADGTTAVSNGNSKEFIKGENGTLSGEVVDTAVEDSWEREGSTTNEISSSTSSSSSSSSATGTPSVGPKEPVYEVIEVGQVGTALKKHVSRRQLLRTSGLRLRDLRRVDPSLWVTNSAPALLVRDQAILLNLGSLRAIATTQEVLIFDQKSVGAQSFIETLVARLNDRQNQQSIPFELEVIESALITRTQRLERALMDVEPRVKSLLEVLPTCMTADVLEELRLSKQELVHLVNNPVVMWAHEALGLVEVASKAGALRQMLLELLEHPQDIRRMVIMGRTCNLTSDGNAVDCLLPQDKEDSEDEEEEMEMLLEYYLQRCESCHGQALKLLSSAKEMEDSIAVNLSSRRLEVSRLELLLQVGTFCAALGALVAGIFGMNLKSYLEDRVFAFWLTTGGIIFGGIALFICMFSYLSNRKIL